MFKGVYPNQARIKYKEKMLKNLPKTLCRIVGGTLDPTKSKIFVPQSSKNIDRDFKLWKSNLKFNEFIM